ncbi:hypothetical protein ABBQ38_000175 [Trebouxia sp. C0009 RCD-2024]
MPTQDVLMTQVVPSMGVFIGTLMFLSPLKAVLDMRKHGRLGELNPIPFPVVIANCMAWVAYALVSKDPYVFLANDPGLLLGLFYTFSAYGYADTKTRNKLTALILIFAVALSGVALAMTCMTLSKDEKLLIWGITANVVLLIYYSAPLTTIKQVIVTRSSASLYWPLCMMNVLNGILWFGYGRALQNRFIWVPNAVGAALGLLQLSLCLVFRRKARMEPEDAAKREPLLNQAAEEERDGSIRASLLNQRRGSTGAEDV